MKGKVCGQNMATQVFNCIQHVFCSSAAEAEDWRGAEIHSPAQSLPQGNWATVVNRKRRWSLWSSGQTGTFLDPERKADSILKDMFCITKLFSWDASNVNFCVCGEEGRQICLQRETRKFRFANDVACQCHQACLITRPCYEAVPDLPTIVTRLSHILKGAKSNARFLKALDQVIDDHFEYIPVLRFPEGYDQWQQESKWCLEASVAAMDLTDADTVVIRQHANGPWSNRAYKHFCLRGLLSVQV